MRIIHCADVHLGSSLTSNYDSFAAKERQGELFTTFTRMLEYAENNHVEAVIIAGDLFDKDSGIKKIKTNVLKAVASHPDAKVFYLKGNHDNKADTEEVPENMKLFNEDWTSYDLGDKVTITGTELSRSNSGIIYNTLNLDRDRFNIVVLHGQQSQYDAKNDAEVINIRSLRNKGIDYLALGHIHTYSCQELDNRGWYCYSGCLEGRGFDEPGKHGFVLLDINENTMTFERTFVPFSKREIFHEEIDVGDAASSFEIAEKIKKRIRELGIGNKDIAEFVMTGDVSLDAEIDENLITQQAKDLVYYLKIKNKTRIKIDYAQYQYDESLKGEFVRLVQSDGSLSEDIKAEIIKMGIDVLAGKEI